MKKIIIFILILISHLPTYSQELFEIITENIHQRRVALENSNDYKQYYPVKVNMGLLTSEEIVITLPKEGKIIYYLSESTDKKWVGKLKDNTGDLLITKGKNSIIASFTTLQSSYQLHATDNEEAFLIELNPAPCDENFCGTDHSIHSHTDIVASDNNLSTAEVTNETLKILVAYTENAEALIKSQSIGIVKEYVDHCIEKTNLTYANSNIVHRLELTACVKVDYEENGDVNKSTDVNYFQGTTDGKMDEIHSLRNIYSADVCVLLIKTVVGNGRAATIGASASSAFCVVNSSIWIIDRYIFGHEIGHLQGAQHDIERDPSIYSKPYSHGYISPNKNWRTVMAYSDYCNGCPAVPYWSNPYVIYPGDGLSMGNTARANNALVLNENTEAMKAFRNPPATISLIQSGVNEVRYGKAEATSKISTSGTVTMPTSSEIILKAPTVELNAGFSTTLGSAITIGPYN